MERSNIGTIAAIIAVVLLIYSIFFSGRNNNGFEEYLDAQNQAFEREANKIIDSLNVIEMRLEMRLANIRALDSNKTIIKNYYQLKANEVNEIFNDSLLADRIRKQIQRLRPARFD